MHLFKLLGMDRCAAPRDAKDVENTPKKWRNQDGFGETEFGDGNPHKDTV
jgi:hypothetical protein